MRDYKHLDFYLSQLAGDIYEQPEDPGHTALAQKVIDLWMSRMTSCKTVLDVGAGQGFCEPMFGRWGLQYEGVALGEDVVKAQELGRNIKKMDFSFLEYEDKSWDLIFSRHSWEHAVMPLPTLMEWYRVSKQWLGLVIPAPQYWSVSGKNHYNVLYEDQVENLLNISKWNIMWKNIEYKTINITDENPSGDIVPNEFWYMCEKK